MAVRLAARIDVDLHHLGARLLFAGVLLSVLIVTCGGVVFLTFHGWDRPLTTFRGEPASLRSIRGILSDAAHLRGRALIQLGVLVLIATPVRRMTLVGVHFVGDRNWIAVGLTIAMLALLTYSAAIG
jgi:uncharacterized membrane protein